MIHAALKDDFLVEGAFEGLLIKAEVSLTCLVLGLLGWNILCGSHCALQDEKKPVDLMSF